MSVMIYHTMNNLAYLIFPTLETETGGLYLLILNVLAVAVLLKLYGLKRMSETAHQKKYNEDRIDGKKVGCVKCTPFLKGCRH